MNKLTIDFETRSVFDLRKGGAAAYAGHSTTEVICLALKKPGEEPVLWYSPDFMAQLNYADFGSRAKSVVADESTVLALIEEADVIEAHNAQFEYFIWKYVMVPRYGFPLLDAAKLRCSAAKAAMYGLPRSLDQACLAAGVSQQKDVAGARLMMQLCKPRRALKADMLRDPDWETRLYWRGTPADFARLGLYCMQDTRAEEALSDVLPELPEAEQKLWQLDLAINDRGVRIDRAATRAILDGVELHAAGMRKEFQRITGLTSPTQRAATLRHLVALGMEMDGLTARDVEKALAATEDETVKRILEIRRSLSKSSTAKYTAFLAACGADDRVRGTLMYHGAGTGRWAGKLIQPQNFPRGAFADTGLCIRLFASGDLEAVGLLYGDPMLAASTCIRGMIVPAEGHDFICADYSAIEGRVLAWLAGEDTALEVYRNGRDPYKVAAAAIHHTEYEEVTKEQRQIGKVAELACIAEGQLVLTDSGLVPIEEVKLSDRVWDGEEFVAHEGVIYRGEREVIEYEGLSATADHFVWCEGQRRPVHFGVAAASGARLVQTGVGRSPLRLGGNRFAGEALVRSVEPVLRTREVYGLWQGPLGVSVIADARDLEGVPTVLAAEEGTSLAGSKVDGGQATLRESGRPGVSELRRSRPALRVRLGSGGGAVGAEKPAAAEARLGDRPNRQRQRVCPGQSPLGHEVAEQPKSAAHGAERLGTGTLAVLLFGSVAQDESRTKPGGYTGGCPESRGAEAQELARHCRKARVYDIMNAGPRHRFTVSGVLVHNCGYQGSVGAFNMMGATYGVSLPEKEVKAIVDAWRESRPLTVKFWRELEEACRLAVENPGKVYGYRGVRFVVRRKMLAMRLPSGRCLWYVNPRIESKMMSWGVAKDVIAFDGVNSTTRKWGTQYLYGGLLAENATQATARDILVAGMFAAEGAGYPVVLHVHDELLTEVPEGFGSVEELENLMCRLPDWADGLPLAAEGWRGKRYRK